MRPSGAAAVAVGLWVLVTVGAAADPGVAAPRRCVLSHYRSLDPRALAAVKALRDRYVSDARDPGHGGWDTPVPVPRGPGTQAPSRCISDVRVHSSDRDIFRATGALSAAPASAPVSKGRPLHADSARLGEQQRSARGERARVRASGGLRGSVHSDPQPARPGPAHVRE